MATMKLWGDSSPLTCPSFIARPWGCSARRRMRKTRSKADWSLRCDICETLKGQILDVVDPHCDQRSLDAIAPESGRHNEIDRRETQSRWRVFGEQHRRSQA